MLHSTSNNYIFYYSTWWYIKYKILKISYLKEKKRSSKQNMLQC